ncbi:MAG: hypothetical protein AAGB32_05075, partial [Pseudomonadota bacterium]
SFYDDAEDVARVVSIGVMVLIVGSLVFGSMPFISTLLGALVLNLIQVSFSFQLISDTADLDSSVFVMMAVMTVGALCLTLVILFFAKKHALALASIVLVPMWLASSLFFGFLVLSGWFHSSNQFTDFAWLDLGGEALFATAVGSPISAALAIIGWILIHNFLSTTDS